MFNFRLGNCLRGYFEGEFNDIDTAWKYLSQRFLLSYPVEAGEGRHVEMLIHKENEYGLEGYQQANPRCDKKL